MIVATSAVARKLLNARLCGAKNSTPTNKLAAAILSSDRFELRAKTIHACTHHQERWWTTMKVGNCATFKRECIWVSDLLPPKSGLA
jgi:hypothetical protein